MDGRVFSVEWPFGFRGAVLDGAVVLIGPDGNVFAREGDSIEMGGGFGADTASVLCVSD